MSRAKISFRSDEGVFKRGWKNTCGERQIIDSCYGWRKHSGTLLEKNAHTIHNNYSAQETIIICPMIAQFMVINNDQ